MSAVCGYSLHLYCDNVEDDTCVGRGAVKWPTEAYGDTKQEAFSMARRWGWRVNQRQYTAICPYCVAESEAGGE